MNITEEEIFSLNYKTSRLYSSETNNIIKGQVNEKGVPLPCHVRLYEKNSGVLFSQVLTDSEGNYSFSNLNNDEPFFIVVHHPKAEYNAVIQDNIYPSQSN